MRKQWKGLFFFLVILCGAAVDVSSAMRTGVTHRAMSHAQGSIHAALTSAGALSDGGGVPRAHGLGLSSMRHDSSSLHAPDSVEDIARRFDREMDDHMDDHFASFLSVASTRGEHEEEPRTPLDEVPFNHGMDRTEREHRLPADSVAREADNTRVHLNFPTRNMMHEGPATDVTNDRPLSRDEVLEKLRSMDLDSLKELGSVSEVADAAHVARLPTGFPDLGTVALTVLFGFVNGVFMGMGDPIAEELQSAQCAHWYRALKDRCIDSVGAFKTFAVGLFNKEARNGKTRSELFKEALTSISAIYQAIVDLIGNCNNLMTLLGKLFLIMGIAVVITGVMAASGLGFIVKAISIIMTIVFGIWFFVRTAQKLVQNVRCFIGESTCTTVNYIKIFEALSEIAGFFWGAIIMSGLSSGMKNQSLRWTDLGKSKFLKPLAKSYKDGIAADLTRFTSRMKGLGARAKAAGRMSHAQRTQLKLLRSAEDAIYHTQKVRIQARNDIQAAQREAARATASENKAAFEAASLRQKEAMARYESATEALSSARTALTDAKLKTAGVDRITVPVRERLTGLGTFRETATMLRTEKQALAQALRTRATYKSRLTRAKMGNRVKNARVITLERRLSAANGRVATAQRKYGSLRQQTFKELDDLVVQAKSVDPSAALVIRRYSRMRRSEILNAEREMYTQAQRLNPSARDLAGAVKSTDDALAALKATQASTSLGLSDKVATAQKLLKTASEIATNRVTGLSKWMVGYTRASEVFSVASYFRRTAGMIILGTAPRSSHYHFNTHLDEFAYKLDLTIIKGEGFSKNAADGIFGLGSEIDPYLLVQYSGAVQKSARGSGDNPSFGDVMTVALTNLTEPVTIYALDHDMLSEDDLIGVASLELDMLPIDEYLMLDLMVYKPPAEDSAEDIYRALENSGSLRIRCKLTPVNTYKGADGQGDPMDGLIPDGADSPKRELAVYPTRVEQLRRLTGGRDRPNRRHYEIHEERMGTTHVGDIANADDADFHRAIEAETETRLIPDPAMREPFNDKPLDKLMDRDEPGHDLASILSGPDAPSDDVDAAVEVVSAVNRESTA